jgi:hypothetical protein
METASADTVTSNGAVAGEEQEEELPPVHLLGRWQVVCSVPLFSVRASSLG